MGGGESPQSYIDAVTFESRPLRVMFCFIRSYMDIWSVMWRGLVRVQPRAIARLYCVR